MGSRQERGGLPSGEGCGLLPAFYLGRLSKRTTFKLGFPCGSAGKESACNEGDLGLIPELGRSPGEWKGYSLQYSGSLNL